MNGGLTFWIQSNSVFTCMAVWFGTHFFMIHARTDDASTFTYDACVHDACNTYTGMYDVCMYVNVRMMHLHMTLVT